jgi:hypothetical protein
MVHTFNRAYRLGQGHRVCHVAEEVHTAEAIVPRDLYTRTDARIDVVHNPGDRADIAVRVLYIPFPPGSSQKMKPHPKSTHQHLDGRTRHPQAISSSYSYYG